MRVATEHHGNRRATAAVGSYSVTLRVWCGSHEGFERKSPLYVRELYPYTLQPRPKTGRGGAHRATGALAQYFPYGGRVVLLYLYL